MIMGKRNGFRTDVFHFRLNRKNSIFTVVCVIFTVFSGLTILPIVHSLPNNEIELPKDVLTSNFKRGLIKADSVEPATNAFNFNNSLSNNHQLHHHFSNDDSIDNFGSHKRLHKKGGKLHKKLHLRKHTLKQEPKDFNIYANDIDVKNKNYEEKATKFDYYPIEPVSLKSEETKKDEKIRFVLITGEEDDKKTLVSDKKLKRRQRRSIPVDATAALIESGISKRSIGYYYPRPKIPVAGLYLNAITPTKDFNFPAIVNRFGDSETGPIWDRRPLPNTIPDEDKPVTRPPTTRRPSTERPPRPTGRPGVAPTPQPTPKGPSSCVWAIINCCSRGNTRIRYDCFEQVGCGGAFWGLNPCGDQIQTKAIEEAEDFFDEYND